MDSEGFEELFHEFLVYNGALEPFVSNVKMCGIGVAALLRRNPPGHWISGAFIWDASSEGGEYWANLSYVWEAIVDDNR